MRTLRAAVFFTAALSTLQVRGLDGVTAIGDVHGDFQTFHALLRKVGLVDEGGHWRGGKRHLVQTGDFLDRGTGSRQVMELLMRLEEEARASGGEVKVLLGNHEVMNLTGDLVSTTYEELTAFRDEEPPSMRVERRERILRLLREGSPLLVSSYTRDFHRVLNERTFDRFFPPGFFAHRAAFAPSGRYGSWLLTHEIIHREETALFLHGGLSPRYGAVPVEELNRRAREDLAKHLSAVAALERLGVFDGALGLRELLWLIEEEKKAGGPHPDAAKAFADIEEVWNGLLFDEEGPLWYRGLALGDERQLGAAVEDILEAQGASAIVIGHTQPRSLRVETRFSNRVVLIDTGMNQAVYGGRPSAVLVLPRGEIRLWE